MIRRRWLAVLCGSFAVFAVVIAVVSTEPAQRTWGVFAAAGYGTACVIALVVPRRRMGGTWWGARLAVLASLGGAVLASLGWMAAAGRAQPEVGVIIRSAALLVHRGTPYESAAALATTHNPNAYDPYLPALIVFGLPRAMLGGGVLTDPRVWFGAVFVVTFGAALAVLGRSRLGWWVAAVTASPIVAFPLSVGGDDLPVLGLLCLGLAVAGAGGRGLPGPRRRALPDASGRALPDARRRGLSWQCPVAAGVVLGMAAAMKPTAWPALVVALALIGARQGKRAAALFGLVATGTAVIGDSALLMAAPGAVVANTIAFPLGMAKVASPAASVLPGRLIAATGPAGRWVAIALLVIAGAAVAASLVVRPPKDAHAAGWRLAIGITLMFLLAPASRYGYFVYPLGLAAWLLVTRPGGLGGWAAAGGPAGPRGRAAGAAPSGFGTWPPSREPELTGGRHEAAGSR
jgi:hypothetical protein